MAKSWNILSFWKRKVESIGVVLSGSKMTLGELKETINTAANEVGLKDSDNIELAVFPNQYKEKETHPDYKLIIKKNTYKANGG